MRPLPLVLLLACSGTTPLPTTSDTGPGSTTTPSDTAPPRPEIDVPATLDFGAVGKGCTAQLPLPVSNVGDYPLSIWNVEILDDNDDVFAATWEEAVISSGDSYDVLVDFTVPGDGSFSGRLRIQSDDRDDALISTDLSGSAAVDPLTTETFLQPTPPRLDLLLVVPRGGDSEDVVAELESMLPGAVDALVAAGLDFQIGVVVAAPGEDSLQGPVAIVTPTTPSAGQAVADNLTAASTTAGTAVFDTVQGALSAPLIDNENAGFLRPAAVFGAVVWSVEDDESATSSSDLSTFVDGLKPDPADASFHTVSGNDGLFGLPCIYGGLINGITVDPAPDLEDAATGSGGLHINLCNSSVGESFGEVVGALTGLQASFELVGPVLDSSTLAVTVDGVTIPEDANSGWVYRANPDRVLFAPSATPPGGSTIEVSYTTAAPCN